MENLINMTVAFDDADGEGIVFFGNYFRLAHRALEQYLPLIGISWSEWFKHEQWGVPLRKVECEYLRPLRPGQTFQAKIQVAELSESTVTFDIDFVCESKVVAKLRSTHVFVDRKSISKMKIPENLRSLLELRLKTKQS